MASLSTALPASEREFAAVAGGLEYTLKVPEMRLQFVVSRLHRGRDELTADLVIHSQIPTARVFNGDVVIAQRFNLSSSQARNTVGRLLKERIPVEGGSLDFYGYLEDLCQRVMAAEATGSPIMEIGQLPARKADTMLLDPLLADGKPTILFGDGGVGKSMMGVGMAVSVRLGQPVIPGVVPTRRGQVLYLDWETDEFDVDARVKAISAGVQSDPVRILYRYCSRPLREGVEDLARVVRERDVQLVVVDSAAAAMGASHDGADASESAVRFFAAIRLLGCTTLVIDHVAKASAGQFTGAGKPYGSTYKVNLARSTWEMRQASGGASDGAVHAAVYHRKTNISALHPGIGLALHFDTEKIWWEREPITNDELIGSLPLAERIQIVLEQNGEMEAKDLVEAVGSTGGAVRSALARNGDKFVSIRRGHWTLIEGGRSGTYRDAFQEGN